MKLRVTVDVISTEDEACAKQAINNIEVANVFGVSANSQREDFLTQAESLMRTISENQIPALYDLVSSTSNEGTKDK